ncbi:AAA family ATPase [Alkalibaculum sp. M08DMB]|uniref:AAA family ATPase n=2 Tax=Alkalibaculum sporogenes TaxID=2655001 RepID=A0A6A7K863_9FIRM|nr:AAA family ATPase [Alkalibaculum sporogenes]
MADVRLKLFEIKNLFNQIDVKLPFEDNVNIFLGENGMGKTTVLNCLYYTLIGEIEKMNSIIFDEITVVFDNDEKLSITHDDIIAFVEEYERESPLYRRRKLRFDSIFSSKEILDLKENNINIKKYYTKISEIYNVPVAYARNEFDKYIFNKFYTSGHGSYENVVEFNKRITEIISDKVLYFPTYRRIEEDITKLGIDLEKTNVKDKLIQFGMSDVETTIENILATIKSAAITGFTKMTGILLKQYLHEDVLTDEDYIIDHEKLSIALARIGDEIDKADKNEIKELVKKSEIYNNKYLLNLIKNLISSYEKQNQYDERVRKFVEVCNSYFSKNKKYIYDESNLELGIYRDNSKNEISIHNLSSGEKQVISIFSKLYLSLNTDESCIILFDEPELSLSIKWQETFLPDIIRSERCKLLVAVTHSPFIFDNEYDDLAKDMGNYILEKRIEE